MSEDSGADRRVRPVALCSGRRQTGVDGGARRPDARGRGARRGAPGYKPIRLSELTDHRPQGTSIHLSMLSRKGRAVVLIDVACCSRGRSGGRGSRRWNGRASWATADPAPCDSRSEAQWRCARSFRGRFPGPRSSPTFSHRNGMARIWQLTRASSSVSVSPRGDRPLTPTRSSPRRFAALPGRFQDGGRPIAVLLRQRPADEPAEYRAPMVPVAGARRATMLPQPFP